ncbi:MAG TPA: type II toxin-antitoxin system prevent-host-death family antitoxin [Thermoanaerobaculia bacterium]|nr:type II toxin-antitoxin system prevent-host-death family antitoxin [Thermoanaerobaculia bacterium]
MKTTYTHARANLEALMDAAANGDPIIIRRRGGRSVAIIAVRELQGLIETIHLLRSPRNAERLLKAIARANRAS